MLNLGQIGGIMPKNHVFSRFDPPKGVSTPHNIKQSCLEPPHGTEEHILGGPEAATGP